MMSLVVLLCDDYITLQNRNARIKLIFLSFDRCICHVLFYDRIEIELSFVLLLLTVRRAVHRMPDGRVPIVK